MALTTLAQVEAALKYPVRFTKVNATGANSSGPPRSWFYHSGYPAAAAVPSPGVAGAALTSYAGQLPFTNPASGETRLARLEGNIGHGAGQNSNLGNLWLCDRLWHNSGLSITLTTPQVVGSVAWPARDINESVNGEGVYIGIEVTAVLGIAAITATMDYTNSAGAAGRTATPWEAFSTTQAQNIGCFFPFGLQAGDTGVRSIQNFTWGVAPATGSISLVAYRPLAILPFGDYVSSIDALTSGFPKLFNDSVPFFIERTASVNLSVLGSGTLTFAQG